MQILLYRLISYLPFPLLYGLAWICYLALYYLIGYRKAVVMENLGHAFPEKSATEITTLAKKFYLHLCQVALEVVKGQRMSPDDFRERVTLVNAELITRLSNNYQDSIIVVGIHQGNWEWMLHSATLGLGIPIDPVYKPLHNQVVDRMVFDIRSKFGSRPLAMSEATRDILRRRREFRLFVMVADQAPIRRERSYWTRFLNRDAAFYLGAETIAKTTGFPVAFACCHRTARGHYRVEFKELAEPPYENEGHAITDRYVALTEQAIREQPYSWLWSNRRWKRDRAAEAARAAQQAPSE